MKLKTSAGEAEFTLLPKGSKKSQDAVYKITVAIILIVLAYVLYQIYKGYNAVLNLPNTLTQTYTDTGGAIAAAVGYTPEEYFAFVNEQSYPTEIAIKAGDTILGAIGATSVLTKTAIAGQAEGQNLNDCRGTLSVTATTEYNELTQEEKLSYNMWACNYNNSHNIDITTFHYAPEIALWKADTGIQKSFNDVVASWFTWS